MVMKRNMMRKNLSRSIWNSLGRYIAIVAIIALGCSIFVGLRVTKSDMVLTGQQYTDAQNMYDLELLGSYGWTQQQVEKIAQIDGVVDAEGSFYLDVYANVGNGKDIIYRLHALPKSINQVYLLDGRMPTSSDECVVDGAYFHEDMLGVTITIPRDSNDGETMDSLKEDTFTVVGRISSPLYMDMTRSSTKLGSGVVDTYVYLPQDAFDVDYYTSVYVTIPGQWAVYSEAYSDELERWVEDMEELVRPAAQDRLEELQALAQEEYDRGYAEYQDGLAEFEKGKAEVVEKLLAALDELVKNQQEFDENWTLLEEGQLALEEGQKELDAGKAELDAGALELENAKAEAYKQFAQAYTELLENQKLVAENLTLVQDGLAQLRDGLAQIEDGLNQIEENLPLLQMMVELKRTQVSVTEDALALAQITGEKTLIELLEDRLETQRTELEEYENQLTEVLATQTELKSTRESLLAQEKELVETERMLLSSEKAIEAGYLELEANQQIAANEFAAAEAGIKAGYAQINSAQALLDEKKAELEAGWKEILEAKPLLEQGWADYYEGKAQAEAEIKDSERELADARNQLADAKKAIGEMELPAIFILDRNTNAGYLALDSNSDIVSGVSRVLPVFFLLIAALVCITTMTRMVEEERTQIGTLKALGHSNSAIMGKYIWYSASASIIGCSMGILVGCTFFPVLLWNAYGIILNIRPDVALTVDWVLCIGTSLLYIAVSTLVTWYCCRRTLREVPAQLIRPKAPEAGKKIFLEYLPFWRRLSFLNKVMLRNVFRYKQRFLMMLIGIGGCTALLMTGFGMRDTIVDLANIQFENVNHFDLQVYFSEGQSEEDQQHFEEMLKEEKIASRAGFFYQSRVEVEFQNYPRDVYLICAESDIQNYLSMKWDDENLGMPAPGETFLSVGVCEILGVKLGDTVTIRNSDMETLSLRVTGIFENHVYNYAVVTPETLEEQWGYVPQSQMAFLQVDDAMDVHDASGIVSGFADVMNIQVCEDSVNMVGNMMDALNMVLWVIILSAGVLGAIVLYNLTNININERIREIATIKVLGFNAAETSAYVFKENILLTCIGIVFGLPLGKWFLDFVMENIKIDMVWFKTRLTFPSYIYAVILSLLCALLVDLIFHKKLQNINMAEALKSVE